MRWVGSRAGFGPGVGWRCGVGCRGVRYRLGGGLRRCGGGRARVSGCGVGAVRAHADPGRPVGVCLGVGRGGGAVASGRAGLSWLTGGSTRTFRPFGTFEAFRSWWSFRSWWAGGTGDALDVTTRRSGRAGRTRNGFRDRGRPHLRSRRAGPARALPDGAVVEDRDRQPLRLPGRRGDPILLRVRADRPGRDDRAERDGDDEQRRDHHRRPPHRPTPGRHRRGGGTTGCVSMQRSSL